MSPFPSVTTPLVTVIVCTRNRGESILATLRSVLTNDYAPLNIVVIDQSNDDATERAVCPLAAADPRLTYKRVVTPGLSRAYNLGIRMSDGEILAFTDDDCVVSAHWISSIVQAFAADNQADLLYGQVLAPRGMSRLKGVIPVLHITRPGRLSTEEGFKVFGMGANFAARRRLFLRIGRFDELLGGGGPLASSQDYDLAYRTYRAGSAILLRPEVWVTHYGVRTMEQWPATERAYGIGDGAFYFKHVRCRDGYALWLLVRRILDLSWREAGRRALGRRPSRLNYLRAIPEGIRRSTRFSVDRRTRVYRAW